MHSLYWLTFAVFAACGVITPLTSGCNGQGRKRSRCIAPSTARPVTPAPSVCPRCPPKPKPSVSWKLIRERKWLEIQPRALAPPERACPEPPMKGYLRKRVFDFVEDTVKARRPVPSHWNMKPSPGSGVPLLVQARKDLAEGRTAAARANLGKSVPKSPMARAYKAYLAA